MAPQFLTTCFLVLHISEITVKCLILFLYTTHHISRADISYLNDLEVILHNFMLFKDYWYDLTKTDSPYFWVIYVLSSYIHKIEGF